MHEDARVILALAADRDDGFLWDQLQTIQAQLFMAGPIAVKFGYFAAEGALRTRPFVATRWATDADDLADLLDHGRANCVCGCFVEVEEIIEQALRETRQGPVQAVVIIGDHFHGDLDHAIATAKQLPAAGTRLFLFQQGRSDQTEHAFEILAAVTGGGYFPFNPHVERVAQRLPGLLEAITHLVIGGMAALAARDDESAGLLLEQMTASQIAQGTPRKDEA